MQKLFITTQSYSCTICNKPLKIDEQVTTIRDGILWETHVVPCDNPNRLLYTLCDSCVQDLDKFLRALANIRQDPFFKDLVLQRFTTNLVKKDVQP